ncbi:hypothetical protein DFH09DRAFT_1482270 [Mycena vulgaris]|nr:hypothetical protein DFH09DRAFT_1482270 [Mycena vulgaris]
MAPAATQDFVRYTDQPLYYVANHPFTPFFPSTGPTTSFSPSFFRSLFCGILPGGIIAEDQIARIGFGIPASSKRASAQRHSGQAPTAPTASTSNTSPSVQNRAISPISAAARPLEVSIRRSTAIRGIVLRLALHLHLRTSANSHSTSTSGGGGRSGRFLGLGGSKGASSGGLKERERQHIRESESTALSAAELLALYEGTASPTSYEFDDDAPSSPPSAYGTSPTRRARRPRRADAGITRADRCCSSVEPWYIERG